MEPTEQVIRHGRLRPGELADAAVLGDLALVLEVIGWFAPLGLGTFFHGLAIVPFAVLATRHRVRAGIVSATAAASVGFLVGGLGIVLQTALAALFGLAVGVAYRRRWRGLTAVGFTLLLAGLPLVAATELLYVASPGFRRLSFAQVRIAWNGALGLLRALSRLPKAVGMAGASRSLERVPAWLSHHGTPALNWIFRNWWVSIPALELIGVLFVGWVCLRMRPFLREVRRHVVRPITGTVAERRVDKGAEPEPDPAPVPVRLDSVSYRYDGTDTDAVSGISLEVRPGRLLVLAGANGSGKSTLVRLIAGRLDPTNGVVGRPGLPGLGRVGGTAMVFQRPESQVLGVRVRDDVCWGLGPSDRPDVGGLLQRVGLGGFEDRETSTLSGGELQRLALAAALARSPQLLISDESTAMVDPEGRATIVALLRDLASSGLAVVHVTHRADEAAQADEVVRLSGGKVLDAGEEAPSRRLAPSAGAGPRLSPKPRPTTLRLPPTPARSRAAEQLEDAPAPQPAEVAQPLVSLRDVGYVYAEGTPWAHQALRQVDLDIAAGEGVVVSGPNGSGKSTLAWLLAGLMVPTSGSATLGGEPLAEQIGRTAIAFQHARLQLLRSRVLADVSLGVDEAIARRALSEVGLDPDEFGERRVDALSGGEQRRVALAGLLVREPELIVLDEPYAGLDEEARLALAAVVTSLRTLRRVAVVVVSHDLESAELLGDRLVRLAEGAIVADDRLRVPA